MTQYFDPPRWGSPPPDLAAEIAQLCRDAELLTHERVQLWTRRGEFDHLPAVTIPQYPTLLSLGHGWDVAVARQSVEKRLLAIRPDLIEALDTGSGPSCTIHDEGWRNARFAAQMTALAALGMLSEDEALSRPVRRWRDLVRTAD